MVQGSVANVVEIAKLRKNLANKNYSFRILLNINKLSAVDNTPGKRVTGKTGSQVRILSFPHKTGILRHIYPKYGIILEIYFGVKCFIEK